ncbi:hypothetical protein C5167_030877 [Papaver somniferum]|nr:hypothetical protein C5167_030877 [Papaver somniferum]
MTITTPTTAFDLLLLSTSYSKAAIYYSVMHTAVASLLQFSYPDRFLFGLVLVPAKDLSSFSYKGSSSSYLLFCGVIIVICSDLFLHGKLLRQVPDLDESQDLVVSTREECCVVIGDCYLREEVYNYFELGDGVGDES